MLYVLPPSLLGCLGLVMSLDTRSLLLFRKPLLYDSLPLGLVTTPVSSSHLQEYTYQLGISVHKLLIAENKEWCSTVTVFVPGK